MGSKIQEKIKIVKERYGYTNKDIAKLLSVSESSLISWSTGRREPRRKYVIQLNNLIKIDNKQLEIQGYKEMDIQADYIIDLQRKQIESQEKEIEILKSMMNDKPVEAKEWEEVEYDFKTTVHCRYKLGKGFTRNIISIDGSTKTFADLGYTNKSLLEDYFRIGRDYPMDEHPCDQLLSKESIKIVKSQTKTMPSLLNSLKNFYNTHYLTMPIVYQSKKNKKILKASICYLKVLWSVDPIIIESKNKFVNS